MTENGRHVLYALDGITVRAEWRPTPSTPSRALRQRPHAMILHGIGHVPGDSARIFTKEFPPG